MNFKLHWSSGAMSAEITNENLVRLESNPDIEEIIIDHPGSVTFDRSMDPSETLEQSETEGELPLNQKQIGMDRVRKEYPKLTGKGVTVGIIDTGVDGNHPLLQGKIKKFYNAKSRREETAKDLEKHGTHVAGLIAASGGIGIAPDSRIIAAAGMNNLKDLLSSLDWILSLSDRPRVINNSWSLTPEMSPTAVYRAIETAERLGVFMVFSAGNLGPKAKSLTRPHEHPFAFSVAASNEQGEILALSSRGPGIYNGQTTQKPEIAAPGFKVRSTSPNGRQSFGDGTSVAAPHVTAVAALLLQANPKLDSEDLRALFISVAQSERDDNISWDPKMGYGPLNAWSLIRKVAG